MMPAETKGKIAMNKLPLNPDVWRDKGKKTT
jgi:hypothetical protein